VSQFDARQHAQDARIALALASGGGPPPPVTDPFRIESFAFNTPSPLVLQSVAAGSYIVRAAILVTQAFNGGGPFVQLGTFAAPALVMGAADMDLRTLGQYEADQIAIIGAADSLKLNIFAPGATQGQALVLWEYSPP